MTDAEKLWNNLGPFIYEKASSLSMIEAAFKRIREEENEACAKIIEKAKLVDWQGHEMLSGPKVIKGLAEAIHARSGKKGEECEHQSRYAL